MTTLNFYQSCYPQNVAPLFKKNTLSHMMEIEAVTKSACLLSIARLRKHHIPCDEKTPICHYVVEGNEPEPNTQVQKFIFMGISINDFLDTTDFILNQEYDPIRPQGHHQNTRMIIVGGKAHFTGLVLIKEPDTKTLYILYYDSFSQTESICGHPERTGGFFVQHIIQCAKQKGWHTDLQESYGGQYALNCGRIAAHNVSKAYVDYLIAHYQSKLPDYLMALKTKRKTCIPASPLSAQEKVQLTESIGQEIEAVEKTMGIKKDESPPKALAAVPHSIESTPKPPLVRPLFAVNASIALVFFPASLLIVSGMVGLPYGGIGMLVGALIAAVAIALLPKITGPHLLYLRNTKTHATDMRPKGCPRL